MGRRILHAADNLSGNTCDYRPIGDIFRHDRAGAHNGANTNRHPRKDRRIAADCGLALDQSGNDFPFTVSHKLSDRIDGARIEIVGEHDAVADEDTIFDRDAFADEGMTGDLAVSADDGVLLDLHEGTDAGARTDPASVEIDQIGVMDNHPITQDDTRCDHAEKPQIPN